MQWLSDSLDGCTMLVMSDYRKGVLGSGTFVRRIVGLCKSRGVRVCIDSKSRDIQVFEGMDFVKPNNVELEEAVGIKIGCEADLERAGRAYLEKSGAASVVVTRGGEGHLRVHSRRREARLPLLRRAGL